MLTPTRELAAQVNESVATYGKNLPLKSTVVFGGVKINPQMMKLRKGVDILVATPGRLLDLYNQKAVRFDDLEVLVLDEADRMLDMGFSSIVNQISAEARWRKQSMLFSATLEGAGISRFAKDILNDPVELEAASSRKEQGKIHQWLHLADDAKHKSVSYTHLTLPTTPYV